MPDGIRIGGAFFEVTADTAPLVRAMAQAQTQSRASAQAIAQATGLTEREATKHIQAMIRQYQQLEQANQRTGRSFGEITRGAAGFAVAAAGITTGALAIHQALSKVAETTQRATQLQFQLTQAYGTSAGQATRSANDLAKATGQSNLAVQEGIARFGVLMRGYGLTRQQTELLAKATLDLAAASGTDTVEAFERMIGVFRDGGESAEKLNLVLNDQSVKAFANLTAEQKKNFEQLDALEKSQIRYTEAMKQAAPFQGAAAQKASEQAGAYALLSRETERLALAFGSEATAGGAGGLVGALSSTVGWLANLIERANEAQVAISQLKQAGQGLTGGLIDALLIPDAVRQRILQNRELDAIGIQGPDPGMPGGTTGGLSEAAARQAIVAQRQQQEQVIAQLVERRKRQISDLADAQEKAARRAADAEDKRIERVITGLEVERAARLKALETRERDTIKAIEAEGKAEQQRFEDEITRLEREKKLRIDTAEEAANQAKRAIEAQQTANEHARELEDRATDDTRRRTEQRIDDTRRYEDRTRDAAQKAEITRLEDLRDARLEAIDDEIKAEEKRTQRALRNIDKQIEKAREKSQSAVRGIEREATKEDDRHRHAMQALEDEATAEDDRHRLAMQALDDEQDARLAILDAQLKALDAADKAEDSARRMADLQRRVAEAQQAVTAARGTGTPEQIAQAREELTRAIRVGNEVSVQNARDRLVKLAGQGNTAIQKADEELAKAQQDLRDEGVVEQRDAERDKLKAAQDAIKDEIDARKRAEDDADRRRKREIDAEKQAEDDRSRRRKTDLDEEKQAEQDKLDDTLKKLERRKQARQDASKDEIDDIKARREAVQEESDEAIAAARATFDDATERLEARRREEDRFREEQRTAQDRQRADERQVQDEDLARQLQAVQDNLEKERLETEAHYNGANGILTTTRKAMEDAKAAYQLRLDDAKLKFAEERDEIKAVYTNEAKTGLIDLQNAAKENNSAALSAQLGALSSWKDQANRFVDENAKSWQSLREAIEATDRAIRNLPSQNGRQPFIRPVDPNSGLPIQGPFPEEGGRGEKLPPPTPPPNTGGSTNTQPTPIPSQVNQYTFDGLSKLELDAACGPAAIDWFSTMVGRPLTGRQAVQIAAAAGWDTTVGMHGPSAMSAALASIGVKNKVNWDVTDDLIDGLARRKVPFTMSTGEHYYQVYGGSVSGLGVGGSGLALRGGSSVMSLAQIRARGYEPRAIIIPDESVIHTRDSGHLFNFPTYTYTPATGQRNLIAERRPELLVGGAQTARIAASGSLLGPAPLPNYAAMGATMAAIHPSASSAPSVVEGDVIFNGLTYDEATRRQRREQHKRELLRGVRSRLR